MRGNSYGWSERVAARGELSVFPRVSKPNHTMYKKPQLSNWTKRNLYGFLYGVFAAGIVSGVNAVVLFFYPAWLVVPFTIRIAAEVSFIEEVVKLALSVSLARRFISRMAIWMVGVGFGVSETILYLVRLHSLNTASLFVHSVLAAINAWMLIWIVRNDRSRLLYLALLAVVFWLHFGWNYLSLTGRV